ncbi:uncharacterized protein MONOS_17686 [Monocercomonoides exilis]|uniref:uncharacterized protein n=1 Tax=Monocercomonoides exilis TaxID=2049356 RepID=UPI00355A0105|nr:hypothetical protein MONOS_17686 [Monocercomonoides exilis]
MDGLRERERGKSGESERLGEASAAQGLHRWCTALQRSSLLLAFTLRMKCGREGSWGREENEGEREVREGREKKNKKNREKGEERKVRVRLREREGNGWVERKRERKEWGVREVGRGECCTGAAQMVHSAAALIPLTRLHSANEEKKGEERKVRVRLREREGNGWVERKRERKEWGVREVGRGECCTGAAQMVHSAAALILLLAFTLRMKCGREGSWGREENEGEREEKKGEERKVRVRLREREGNGWVERKRERKEWGVREVGRGECCTGAAQMVHSAAALIPLTRLHSANENKKIVWDEGMEREGFGVQGWGEKGEERKVRVRLREREGNGWVERKRERKEWGVREVGRGECCTGAAQMVHSAAALIPSTRLHSANEVWERGSWGREENEGEREVREGREKKNKKNREKGEERKVRVRLREREGNGWVERKRERKEWGVREVGRGECCTGAAQMCGREGSWGREENEGEREVREGREKRIKKNREKGEERKVRVRLREREGNGWVERKRERKEWGVREVGRGECCTGAAQMVHSAVALIPSYSPSLCE